MEKVNFNEIDKIISEHGAGKANIIAILQDIQDKYNYLPREIFEYLSEKLSLSLAQIYSVVTFYENFSLEPKGKYIIKICDGTACHVRKSIPILEAFRKELSLSDTKHTTDDLMFTVETVSCLGACSLAPVIMLNDEVHPAMTPDKVRELLSLIKGAEANA